MVNFNFRDDSFVMPAIGRAEQHKAITEYFTGVKPKAEPEPGAPAAPSADEADFDALVVTLEKTLGPSELERVFPASDRATARSDTAKRAIVTKNLATFRMLRAGDAARAGLDAAKSEQAEIDRELSRFAGLAKGIADAEHAARGAK